MKILASTLPFLLLAATSLSAVATEPADTKSTAPHGKIVLSLDQDGINETFNFDQLAVGESRQIAGKNGKLVTITRAADALTIEADGKTTRITPPGNGVLSQIKLLRTGDGGEERRVLMLHGDKAHDFNDDVIVLDGNADGLDLEIEEALSRARIALDAVDQETLDAALAKARAQIDAVDADAVVAQARADGSKVVLIRRKIHTPDTTD